MKQYLAFAYNAFTLLGICDSKICIKKTVLFFFYEQIICLANLFINGHNTKVNLTPISILSTEDFELMKFFYNYNHYQKECSGL